MNSLQANPPGTIPSAIPNCLQLFLLGACGKEMSSPQGGNEVPLIGYLKTRTEGERNVHMVRMRHSDSWLVKHPSVSLHSRQSAQAEPC